MQVGVKSSPDSFYAIAFILSKYRTKLGKILNFVKKYIL